MENGLIAMTKNKFREQIPYEEMNGILDAILVKYSYNLSSPGFIEEYETAVNNGGWNYVELMGEYWKQFH